MAVRHDKLCVPPLKIPAIRVVPAEIENSDLFLVAVCSFERLARMYVQGFEVKAGSVG